MFYPKVVCMKDDIFAFCGFDNECITSVEKFSKNINAWETLADLCDARMYYSACSFMGNIYVIGGNLRYEITSSCLKFNQADWYLDRNC